MPFKAPAEEIWEERGKQAALLRLMERKFGPEAVALHRERIEQTDSETLLVWLDRILTAESADEVLH